MRQVEDDLRLVGVGVAPGLRVANIGAADLGHLLDLVNLVGAARGRGSGRLVEQHRIVGHGSAQRLQCGGLIRPRAALDGMDLKPRGGLNNVVDARQIVDSRQLDQDLVAAQVVFLDDRLAHAQRVDAGADDLDRLLERALLEVLDRAWASWSESRRFRWPRRCRIVVL